MQHGIELLLPDGLSSTDRRRSRAVAAGRLVRIRRGVYVDAEEWGAADARRRLLARIEAYAIGVGTGVPAASATPAASSALDAPVASATPAASVRPVASARPAGSAASARPAPPNTPAAAGAAAREPPVFVGESAAALLGIPIIGAWPERVQLLVPPNAARTSGAVVRVQRTSSAMSTVPVRVGGTTVLAAAPHTTAIDLAVGRGALSGAIGISHVRGGGVELERFTAELVERAGTRGVRIARQALELSSDGCESPLEALVVARCHDLGFQLPRQQYEVVLPSGRVRVDFAWSDGAILAEADGRAKYEDERMLAGRSGREVVWAEKLREDALRERCRAFVRITWDDAWHATGLVRKLASAGVPRPRPPRPLTR